MSTSELTAAICSATRGRYWPFVTTIVRAKNSTGSQTRPVVSREAFGGTLAAGLAAQLLKWHFVLAEPTSNGYQSHHCCIAHSLPFSASTMALEPGSLQWGRSSRLAGEGGEGEFVCERAPVNISGKNRLRWVCKNAGHHMKDSRVQRTIGCDLARCKH